MIRSPDECACPIQEVGPSMVGSCPSNVMLFMAILEAFINGRCDLADPCKRVVSQENLDESYDFVIAGGGTAGSVLAGRLSENPQWKVLLIEAGGDEPTQSSVPSWVTAYWGRDDTDWNYVTEPQEKACLTEEGKCSWTRAKMLGGCSVTNGMMYMRGHAADYDGWAINGAKGWSWYEVMPYFLRSEDNKEIGRGVSGQYHSAGGPIPVQKFRYAPKFAHDVVSAGIELGYPPTSDLNGDTITGFTIAQTQNDNGSRYSAARAFVRPATHRENLHVLLNAHVARIVINPATKKVTGVEYIKNGEKRTVGVKREAIVSGGTINSPQILMLSGVGPKETLERFNIPVIKNLPGVGQNLHNHVGVHLHFTLTKEAEIPELNWETAMEYMLQRDGPLSATGLSQLTGIVNSRYAAAGGRQPDVQFFFGGYYAGCSSGEIPDPDSVEEKRLVEVSAICLTPRSRGYVTIQSVDPEQKPIMQPNYFFEEHELNVIADAARIAYRLANTTIMREKYGMKPSEGYGEKECGEGGDNPSDEFFKCLAMHYTAPENHQAGTCKMGPDTDPMAVVDMQLKVHGIEGLRVADASIMPTVVTSNTAAPTVMIAERASEFITTRYQLVKKRPIDGLNNRFGDSDGSGTTSNEGFGSGNYASNEAKDDRITDNQTKGQDRWDHRWKPWDRDWTQWDKPVSHNVDWNKKRGDYPHIGYNSR
ncbi:glucose dehydrogenase [FAD, quinone]-like [Ostrinia nubilalis]|uniref:glucose dehydrogenase [FAD, quinone]-like n=1 Tax=Ostrinia nubilalis TaxID=29057 RepID=UPI00308240EF